MKKYIFLLFAVFSKTLLVSQDHYLDSLTAALKTAKHDTTRCNLLINIAEYQYGTNPDTVVPLSEKTIQLADRNLSKSNNAERKAFLKAKGVSLNNIAAIKADKGNLNSAIDYYLASLKVHTDNQYKPGISDALNNLGIVYDNLGDASGALEYFHKALKIQEELHLIAGLALTLNNIAFIYAVQNEPAKALEYNNRSLKYRIDINDKEGITQSLNNIASIYEKFGVPGCNKDKETCMNEGLILALSNYKKCLEIQTEIGDKRGMAYSLNNIASVYRKFGDPDFKGTAEEKKANGLKLSMEYLKKSLSVHEEIKNNVGIAYGSNNLAQVYIQMNKLNDAFVYSNKSLQLGKQFGYPEIIQRSAATLKKIYMMQNKFKDAFAMYELEMQMKDSSNSLSNQKALITQNTKYEYEKKAAADSIRVYEEKKVINAQLKQEKTQRFALYGGIVLVGLFGAFMFNRFKVTKKQNDLIQIQKAELQVQKELVEEHQKETLDSIHYAKRIQTALIANSDFLTPYASASFSLPISNMVFAKTFKLYDIPSSSCISSLIFRDCKRYSIP